MGTEPRSCASTRVAASPASRSTSVSPTHTMAISPAAIAASAFPFTSASVSCCAARRSLWPTIASLAPASASIPAEMQPVNAPRSPSWQSCPPIGRPGWRAAARSISVKGGKMATSTSSRAFAAAAIPSSSTKLSRSPFIFQLPAISGLRMLFPSNSCSCMAALDSVRRPLPPAARLMGGPAPSKGRPFDPFLGLA